MYRLRADKAALARHVEHFLAVVERGSAFLEYRESDLIARALVVLAGGSARLSDRDLRELEQPLPRPQGIALHLPSQVSVQEYRELLGMASRLRLRRSAN